MAPKAWKQRMPGRNHECEPEDEPKLLAGALWELDVYSRDEDRPGIDTDLLQPLLVAGVPGIPAIHRRCMRDGQPDPWNCGGHIIQQATEAARLAGYDCYDSDTRTWVYAEPTECRDCGLDAETACWKPLVPAHEALIAHGVLQDLLQRFPHLRGPEALDSEAVVAWLRGVLAEGVA